MKDKNNFRANEVFGLSRDLPLNYITRETIDQALIDNLTRDKHIVIYGSSKQGKTSLRKYCLEDQDYIVVQCSNKWSLAELNAAILKQAGYEVTQSTTKTVSGRNRLMAKISAGLWGLGNAEAEGERESENSKSTTITPLELDPEDVNDIIEALKNFKKFIVLEDFHYLNIEAQKDFAVALKAFHEKSKLCFIIVGVWLEEGRLTVYNGDLTGRTVGINADKWTRQELKEVIVKGENLLNINFADEFKNSLLDECFDSVYIVQEACYKCCHDSGVFHTQEQHPPLTIGNNVDAKAIVKSVVNEQSGRYTSFISQFASGFQETNLQMYKWLLLPLLVSDVTRIEQGLRLAEIRKALQANHPSGSNLNVGNITQALQSTASLQVDKDIKPIIIDYDQTNLKLNVVDLGFLIWLNNQDRNELLELADLPEKDQIKSWSPNAIQQELGL
ncbi:MAG: hypothetical protein OT477_02305 [Chloroflexi bacterium]|nr:hypothetical protein [Chloroflexota bacterium]